MSLLHRLLSEDTTDDTVCESVVACLVELKELGSCSSTCLNNCPSICNTDDDVTTLSPPPMIHHNLNNNLKRILIILASSIITTLFLLTLLLLCYKWYTMRRRSITLSRRWSMEEILDEPSPVMVVDHPVWHIRTIGLSPTVISSIKVCKYSKRDGVVEGTDCSVCLSEFEEEETLRLLPKCRHAFHLSCIDTWLSSHTNCPLCRAPIVVLGGDDDGDDVEEILVSIQEEDGEVEREHEEEEADGEEDKLRQRVRRSVSLNSLSGGKEKVKRSNVGRSSVLKRSISYNGE